ncbi:uncharacterized protein LOC144494696 [Mustelus asterias]
MSGHRSLASCMLLAFFPHLLQELPHAWAQSGSSDVDDEPDLPRITCFSNFANSALDDRLTCELTEPIADSEPFNVTFSEDQVTESCEINPRVTHSCSVAIQKFALFRHCCIRVSKMDSAERSLCVYNKKIIHMGEISVATACAVYHQAGGSKKNLGSHQTCQLLEPWNSCLLTDSSCVPTLVVQASLWRYSAISQLPLGRNIPVDF